METVFLQLLALVITLVISITIGHMIYCHHYRTYLRPKVTGSQASLSPAWYPEDGEDASFCNVCHGRLGVDKIAICACGNKFHRECVRLHECPRCGNDLRHMWVRKPAVMLCPICLRTTLKGHCTHCEINIPRKDGTFICEVCQTRVFVSNPVCRKCGQVYLPRKVKGYMSRIRSR